MNERIQKLRLQAWYYADDNSHDGDDGKHGQLYAEKFAQLIVRECLDIVDDEGCGEGGSVRAIKSIQDRFGVEE